MDMEPRMKQRCWNINTDVSWDQAGWGGTPRGGARAMEAQVTHRGLTSRLGTEDAF